MNILFLTLAAIRNLNERSIYLDLMNEFAGHCHDVFIVSPLEKKYQEETRLSDKGRLHLVQVRTGNLFQVGMLEKGISQLLLGRQYERAIREFWADKRFDLILYSTPPITLAGTVKQIKKKTNAKTYLLLKDIFPQNAVDIGVMSKWMARLMFRGTEKKLYRISDYIGCMSPANVRYVLEHNKLERQKVEECPNSIMPDPMPEAVIGVSGGAADTVRAEFCCKYGLPQDKVLFLYGGNLGKPQDIPFLLQCVEATGAQPWAYFIVCGTGTELEGLKSYVEARKPSNMRLIPGLPKQEYEKLVEACDVGMIFLDYRFTIPNFPSRLLSYMEKGLPVLACTDPNTDIGLIAEENGFGKGCRSNDTESFVQAVGVFEDKMVRMAMGQKGRSYLEEHYTAEKSYEIIMRHFENEKGRKT